MLCLPGLLASDWTLTGGASEEMTQQIEAKQGYKVPRRSALQEAERHPHRARGAALGRDAYLSEAASYAARSSAVTL